MSNKSTSLEGNIKLYGLGVPPEYYGRGFGFPRLSKDKINELIGEVDKNSFSILLGHAPDFIEGYTGWGADLSLAGHFHGGMVRLPIVGGVISPRLLLFPKYDYGLYIHNSKREIVTNGLGQHSIKLRLNNIPEIVQINIRKTKYEFMNYQDVTKTKIIHRNTNPLRPQYKWSYIEDKKLLGPIDGNIPIVYSKYMYRNPFNLNTKDIEGANTGSTYPILRYKGSTFYLNTKDIEGAQGDTLIRGIITKRNINPITPVYQYLGHSEIQNMDNNPYFIDFNKSKSKNKKNIKKIKDPNDDDKIKNKTINEYRALNRKLLTNKFYGHLSKNISDKTLEFKTHLKNKFFDLTDINNKIKKFNKLKEQLRPLNKRKMKIEKNYSTFN